MIWSWQLREVRRQKSSKVIFFLSFFLLSPLPWRHKVKRLRVQVRMQMNPVMACAASRQTCPFKFKPSEVSRRGGLGSFFFLKMLLIVRVFICNYFSPHWTAQRSFFFFFFWPCPSAPCTLPLPATVFNEVKRWTCDQSVQSRFLLWSCHSMRGWKSNILHATVTNGLYFLFSSLKCWASAGFTVSQWDGWSPNPTLDRTGCTVSLALGPAPFSP